ncbi:MAG: ACP S-malonyltransferase [Deltaproteobacteria bacterium]|nr:ACP S-malonyltransferase [Deltaproteobacteria bacterium]
MANMAFLFPGQGSQYVGMGVDLYNADAGVRGLFQLSEEITGLPLTTLCFSGPMEELTQTVNLQPAITLVNLCLYQALKEAGVTPNAVCGHSLGEYSALYAAGVLSAEDTIAAVRERGRLMHREAQKHPGAMAAVIGLTPEKLAGLVGKVVQEGPIALANFNTPEQVVISGSPEMVARAGNLAKAEGGRVIPLKVSGAWHSPLMTGANEDFAAFLAKLDFKVPKLPIYLNATARPEEDPERLRQAMSRQLTSPVRWADLIFNLKAAGVDTWVEVGPKNVLTGLVKKILPQEPAENFYNVENLESLEAFVAGRRGGS